MAVAAASRGIGAKLGLREIRLHLCQRSPGSQGVREFIEKHYVELKKANPALPILIRECSDVQPKLWARYGERGSGQFGTPIGEQGLEKRRSSRVTQKPHLAKRRMSL
ncbi:NADH dehydrogenase [ubiquinone] 1 alpha subcomplex subunit 2 isoform X1 [Mustela lutreola]|uniref:NADH dehydrogenase [ubiquinone] 1 alpha subcomplex subunit 2 n=1 Tax=Mustela putorius furo TaxID=9669 RepID=A0A8U0RUT4_MUSPF|nr:NADH dehydrogenase [ubiquinone] 1 alpha subcomplex subunit 2 isoform X1 [Mustela putorius furo]XP_059030794.1 NADH dehydrogenase [ubiquinone] 1 alpha subcomplex subunit 2 isoform X1 [Mustela lutreola]